MVLDTAKALAKPIDSLINRVFDAIGTLYKPTHIKKIAKAKVDGEITKALGDIKITDIKRKALNRMITEQQQYQNSIECVVQNSFQHLTLDSHPENIESDWLRFLFDKARLNTDKDILDLWSRILAGEANQKGSFSKRTLSALSTLNKNDAENFINLCRFCWEVNDGKVPLIFDYKDKIYSDNGLSFGTLEYLDELGLIKFKPNEYYDLTIYDLKQLTIKYINDRITVQKPKSGPFVFQYGRVAYTKIGQELLPIVAKLEIPGFTKYIFDRLSNLGFKVEIKNK